MNIKKLVGGIFLAVGLIFIGVAIFLYNDTQDFLANSETSKGRVVDLVIKRSSNSSNSSKITQAAVVRFVDRKGMTHEFVDSVSSNPPRYSKGQTIKLYYDPQNPSNAKVADTMGLWFVPMIFGGMGSVFALIGGLLLFLVISRSRNAKWLREHGTPVTAEFKYAAIDGSQRVGSKRPYRIIAQAKNPFNGKIEQYESEPIWFDPTDHIKGKDMRVFIDPDKPKRHFLDVDWIKDMGR